MSLVDTTHKLGVSFFEYMRDPISKIGDIPSLDKYYLVGPGTPNNSLLRNFEGILINYP